MSVANPALTMFSEDELAFRDAIRSFAEGEIKPIREEMDHQAQMKPELVKQLFEMGLMGIDTRQSL